MNIRVNFSQCYYELFFCIAFLFSLAFSPKVCAQQYRSSDAQFVAPRKKKREVRQKIEAEPPLKMNGILVKAVKSQNPVQVISPFAPDSYGNGEEMISEDPNELGKENGLILFGVEW